MSACPGSHSSRVGGDSRSRLGVAARSSTESIERGRSRVGQNVDVAPTSRNAARSSAGWPGRSLAQRSPTTRRRSRMLSIVKSWGARPLCTPSWTSSQVSGVETPANVLARALPELARRASSWLAVVVARGSNASFFSLVFCLPRSPRLRPPRLTRPQARQGAGASGRSPSKD